MRKTAWNPSEQLRGIAKALHVSVESLAEPPEPERGDPTVREAWAALRMIREAIETLGPVGVLPSAETVQRERGPMLLDEAGALVEGIKRIADRGNRLG